ncbi:MAG TPA: tetratricopeptide repeat protein [Burkholderiales bacterium]|jgi:Flp pilus assembly protein TadD|nr:tetratricopeptide repeat protein [Burkholderiales bacterium]
MKRYTAKTFQPDASDLNHEAYLQGCRLFKAAKYKKAIKAFDEAVSYWPKDGQAWMALGNCYDELRRPVDAEKCLRRALAYYGKKDRAAVQFNLGNSLFDQERYKEAIEHYEQVPKSSDVFDKARKNSLMAEEYAREQQIAKKGAKRAA